MTTLSNEWNQSGNIHAIITMADAGRLLTAPERLIRLFGVLQQIIPLQHLRLEHQKFMRRLISTKPGGSSGNKAQENTLQFPAASAVTRRFTGHRVS